ncbi:MAG TPA: thiamine phosphate synthase [Gemmatimonadales bacterium]|nr:thiamine phosphate synthase [Gemmatimonadales bacterium]
MKPSLPRLHAITDERIARRADLDDVAAELARGGGADLAFHARGRALTGREHYELAGRLAVRSPARLFVNDRLDIALAVPSAGVHLGRASLPVEAARELNPVWWIGRSVHDLAEAETASLSGPDYLVVGPVFQTASHPGHAPLGLETLNAIVAAAGTLPVIAIGGITADRVQAVKQAGAYGVAAIRALWDDVDPAAAARRMREWIL